MPYAASLSQLRDLPDAVDAVCDEVREQLQGRPPDLSFVFASHTHAEGFGELAAMLLQQLKSKVLVGCAGETIVGGGDEIEEGPALSLWSAVLPGAEIVPFHIEFGETPDGLIAVGFPDDLADRAAETRAVFFLGEPFTSVADSVIDRLADELPGVPLIGGMASGGSSGSNRLFLNGDSLLHGAVAVVMRGGPRVLGRSC